MFKSGMGLGKRLTISFTVIIAFMAVLAILSSSRIEEAASAAQSMHNEADNLSNAISVFKLGDDGDCDQIEDVQAIGYDT